MMSLYSNCDNGVTGSKELAEQAMVMMRVMIMTVTMAVTKPLSS